ncbi:YceI family protein [Rothia uropygialis]|uniref:YceI family protein n=1 Tax=Kocuria sp. 36 TaxID=1415402 RepID=UPI00101C2667|nr:YceI family protein [Kocuria sp. 36]
MTTFNELSAGTWTLDPAHSEVEFTVRHAGISKVRGTFQEVSAELNVGEQSSVTASANIASLDSGNADRDGHVKGADFFDAENYPTMTFTSTSIESDGEDFTLNGDLTIKDETRPVSFKGEFGGVAVDPFGATRAGFSASTSISRKDFGMTWNAALETGGVLVSDKVNISLEVSFIAPQA